MMTAPINSIRKNCLHQSYCVLTIQKDQVWSCQEYDLTTIKNS